MAGEKCAERSTQLEVDEAILDYLLFTAIQALLHDTEASEYDRCMAGASEAVDIPLQLVDSFLLMFRAMHPDSQSGSDLQFRLRLLKFTALFTKRFTPSTTSPSRSMLQRVRSKRRKQANAFRPSGEDVNGLNLPDLSKYLDLADDIPHIKKEKFSQDTVFPDTKLPKPSTSLLDTLPSFMALSAAENAMQGGNVTEIWMKLAAGYMAHAVAEQYLAYGSHSRDVLEEAFNYGFDPETTAEEGTDEWMVNAMFWGEDEEIAGWYEIRDEHVNALFPSEGSDLQDHLKTLVATELPHADFEKCVFDFLHGLLRSHSRPLLAQIESDRMDGLSRKETRTLQEAVGIT